MYSKKTKRCVQHKICMALVNNDRRAGSVITNALFTDLKRMAAVVADKIEAEYCSKNGAGGIWLSRLIEDNSIMDYV